LKTGLNSLLTVQDFKEANNSEDGVKLPDMALIATLEVITQTIMESTTITLNLTATTTTLLPFSLNLLAETAIKTMEVLLWEHTMQKRQVIIIITRIKFNHHQMVNYLTTDGAICPNRMVGNHAMILLLNLPMVVVNLSHRSRSINTTMQLHLK